MSLASICIASKAGYVDREGPPVSAMQKPIAGLGIGGGAPTGDSTDASTEAANRKPGTTRGQSGMAFPPS